MAALCLLLSACGNGESALVRGDRFWADSNYHAALAEYRLSLRHRGEQDEILARVAHAYAHTGQLSRAREHYDRLVSRAPEYTDQAVFDFVMLAHRAQARGDRHGLASAAEAALAWRPGLPFDDLAAPLARYYAAMGDTERALDFLERALAHAPADSIPPLLYELAETHIARGNCEEALGFLRAFQSRAPRHPRAEQVRWHIGSCSFELGRQARIDGRHREALERLRTIIELGTPRNMVGHAWFERGEALLALGQSEEALSAFYMVVELDRGRASQLGQRAQQRIDQLRFSPAWR